MPVAAKQKVDAIITELLKDMGYPDAAAYRTRALAELNEAELWFAAQGSFHHLAVDSTVTLGNGLDAVNVPADCDTGKTATLFLSGGGTLEYREHEDLANQARHTYGAWDANRPSSWRWSSTAAGVMQLKFDRANGTGGNLVYPISYQRLVNALVDDGATESTLPVGYERTILRKRAEMTWKRKAGILGWKDLELELLGEDGEGGLVETFFEQFRTSKNAAVPDAERVRQLTMRRETAAGA